MNLMGQGYSMMAASVPGLDPEQLWAAVRGRDESFDGRFVFAVRSTGVYCRPSCPSRRPRRDRVLFFPLAEAAEGAGFRSCRRCHPRSAKARNPQVQAVQRACRWIENHVDQPVTLEVLSEETGVSPFHLQRTFKRLVGVTPRQYGDACRVREFKSRVRDGASVTGAMYDSGFGSSRGLYERADARLGMTPGTYRRGGDGMRIKYTLAESPFGWLLVAGTEKGVCSVKLGGSRSELESLLKDEFSAADVRRDDRSLREWREVLVKHLDGKHPHIDLPLDVRATAFQCRVWQALRAIPYGETRSYGEVAKGIGRPSAVRAVARACATNPVALVVPCHRVVRGDDSLGGYRWGVDRKKALLARERNARRDKFTRGNQVSRRGE